jgi:hypothetical protein
MPPRKCDSDRFNVAVIVGVDENTPLRFMFRPNFLSVTMRLDALVCQLRVADVEIKGE